MAFLEYLSYSGAQACNSGRYRPQQRVDRFCRRNDDIAHESKLTQSFLVFRRKSQWLLVQIALRIFSGGTKGAVKPVPLLQTLDKRGWNFAGWPGDAKFIVNLAICKSRPLHSQPLRTCPVTDLVIGEAGLFQ